MPGRTLAVAALALTACASVEGPPAGPDGLPEFSDVRDSDGSDDRGADADAAEEDAGRDDAPAGDADASADADAFVDADASADADADASADADADASADADADASADADADASDGGPLDPDLALPDPSGTPCTTPGSTSVCPGIAVCRFYDSSEGRCESCSPCGNLGSYCSVSSECDILFVCFRNRCTNICPLGTYYCGPIDDCLNIGHPTHGVCRP